MRNKKKMDWNAILWILLAFVIIIVVFAVAIVYQLWLEVVETRKFVSQCVLEEELQRLFSMTCKKSSDVVASC